MQRQYQQELKIEKSIIEDLHSKNEDLKMQYNECSFKFKNLSSELNR